MEPVITVKMTFIMPDGSATETRPFIIRHHGDLSAECHKVKAKAGERFMDALHMVAKKP